MQQWYEFKSGVTYIDVYSHLVSEGFSTVDGTHYPHSVSIDIYNLFYDHLEEQKVEYGDSVHEPSDIWQPACYHIDFKITISFAYL